MSVVSFTTDYGLADGFVAACHGVILCAAPDARIIDVTHLVPPGDVRRAATVLAQTVGSLPRGVHLAVVDPGVGTSRRAVALRAAGGDLVGPDNGLLIDAAERLGGIRTAVSLPVPAGTPATFHGRDVFAPAAARLARGDEPAALGPPLDPATLVRLPGPYVHRRPDGALETEVVLVDIFGNVQLAASAAHLGEVGLSPPARALLSPAGSTGVANTGPQPPAVDRAPAGGLRGAGGLPRSGGLPSAGIEIAVGVTFASVAPGEPLLYADAAGMAALAVRDGDAAAALGLAPGDRLALQRA
ncbi:SAM-dependent chlorinase/fluorinase [Frankia sp. AgB32]|uniref:SAM hydrolase/SAM-dependent halogenase family protein n=1 Tax=Frankia sp. AgB32 TaxID=631119 RepID=UPI00200F9EA0|nr:SAM-dependent chlorinase/fluorinase [Frankia sp. AgB32]MCK9894843.1 SAM-dependent chlorinase/fluorinase [Frankia sp. AgB32]